MIWEATTKISYQDKELSQRRTPYMVVATNISVRNKHNIQILDEEVEGADQIPQAIYLRAIFKDLRAILTPLWLSDVLILISEILIAAT